MSDELNRPVGGPALLDAVGVQVVPHCSECGVVVDLSTPDHHVCIPVKGGAARKSTALVAEAEYLDSLPTRLEAATAEAAARPAEDV